MCGIIVSVGEKYVMTIFGVLSFAEQGKILNPFLLNFFFSSTIFYNSSNLSGLGVLLNMVILKAFFPVLHSSPPNS